MEDVSSTGDAQPTVAETVWHEFELESGDADSSIIRHVFRRDIPDVARVHLSNKIQQNISRTVRINCHVYMYTNDAVYILNEAIMHF